MTHHLNKNTTNFKFSFAHAMENSNGRGRYRFFLLLGAHFVKKISFMGWNLKEPILKRKMFEGASFIKRNFVEGPKVLPGSTPQRIFILKENLMFHNNDVLENSMDFGMG